MKDTSLLTMSISRILAHKKGGKGLINKINIAAQNSIVWNNKNRPEQGNI